MPARAGVGPKHEGGAVMPHQKDPDMSVSTSVGADAVLRELTEDLDRKSAILFLFACVTGGTCAGTAIAMRNWNMPGVVALFAVVAVLAFALAIFEALDRLRRHRA